MTLILTMLTFSACTASAHARLEYETPSLILRVDLNADGVADTLTGVRANNQRFSNITMHWGVRPDSGCADSSWYAQHTGTTFRPTTTIKFDSAINVQYSAYTLRHNDDDYTDLVVNVTGKREKVVNGDTTYVLIDTNVTVVLFAQRGLDSLISLSISGELGVHSHDATYRTIEIDNGIVVSDSISRSRVYVGSIPRYNLTVDVRTVEPPPIVNSVHGKRVLNSAGSVNVVPNPSSADEVVVEVTGIGNPTTMVLLSSNGLVVNSFSIPHGSGTRIRTLVSHLPAGMYGVVATGGDGRVATGQFLIIR